MYSALNLTHRWSSRDLVQLKCIHCYQYSHQELAEYAEAHIEEADAPLFLRFINLLVNDATFLLDEALSVSLWQWHCFFPHLCLSSGCSSSPSSSFRTVLSFSVCISSLSSQPTGFFRLLHCMLFIYLLACLFVVVFPTNSFPFLLQPLQSHRNSSRFAAVVQTCFAFLCKHHLLVPRVLSSSFWCHLSQISVTTATFHSNLYKYCLLIAWLPSRRFLLPSSVRLHDDWNLLFLCKGHYFA